MILNNYNLLVIAIIASIIQTLTNNILLSGVVGIILLLFMDKIPKIQKPSFIKTSYSSSI